MSLNTINTALRLYQDGDVTLDQASARSDCSTAKLVAELQSRGIALREADREAFGSRHAR